MKLFKASICFIFLATWMLGIIYMSLTSSPKRKMPLYETFGDNLWHLLAFFVLFILFYVLFSFISKKLLPRLTLAFIFTLGFSIFKELLQVPRIARDFSFGDIELDGLGIIFAAALIIGKQLLTKKKQLDLS